MKTCPACGQASPKEARFCPSCGTSLASAAPRLEERKVITILFADLVGFTSKAEQLDPEAVRGMLDPYYAQLRSVLEPLWTGLGLKVGLWPGVSFWVRTR